MRNGMQLTTSIGLIATVFFLAVPSSAQVEELKSDEGYGYRFDDDPLNAGGFSASEATIRVRPVPPRTTLIRLRTSFVPAMLKSVQNL